MNEEQRDTADVLLWLFSERVLKAKAVLGNPERARALIVKMAGRNKTLANLRRAMALNPQGRHRESVGGFFPGSRRDAGTVGRGSSSIVFAGEEGVQGDRSFDASGYIESNFLGPRALEALRDYDPMESLRWVEWAMLRSTTIMKSIEPRRLMQRRGRRRLRRLSPKLRRTALADAKEKGVELQCLKDREAGFLADLELAKKGLSEEKSRADKAESVLAVTEQARQELIKLAEDSVKATEDALKEQILVLAPDFNVSLLGAWKVVVDGQIMDLPLQPSQD
ncbi:hypothetical protein PIB30_049650 [Stylosanthes scabra]|uniref:Uncharacterized protein n=1 Tax=Stylosanthes scabra TaxID=79078 RepID=A0ABU6SH79_9FABA|nr:hypothetical protein [Stylosanthes scabra]